MNQFIPNPMATIISMANLDEAPVLDPELQAKADALHAETMALAEALCRSTLMPGNDTTH
ncbi:hypothetical protein PAGU2196_23250 [Pseudomonas sp. PAGU 2196]|uniref:hypothetical protein n=1 Tax=Pseudomonas sp. PAGU 2196 TaxID=2793997 RepID=UPI001EDFF986|nr:hypothetical protein [Pseudomonas sp. PAGU 2196]GHS81491.1 hypothetical protein PAGU2196_23250 [Pseudomonas sp. PAGU 2196]